MICPPCKTGGQLSATARGLPPEIADRILENARAWHDRCEYPQNCPCHHQVGLCTARDSEVPK